jgi:hypothetical protein
MAQRMLSDKEAVVLNLIYLAKAYQHKYKDNTNDFLLQCAGLVFKYDTLSMNALLLKAEITENRLLASMKENKITKLSKARVNPQTKLLLASYEKQLSNLYKIGYREIPKEIEKNILAHIQHRNEGYILKDQTPNPFASIKAKQRYMTLSNGLFDEMHEAVDTIQYYHALLNTKTKKIIKLLPIEASDEYKVDPVVFALSVDPMADKYPGISPYAYCAWNPIMLVDPDGRSTNPIYDFGGNFLGTDDKGLKGDAIMMDKSSFTQGMSHDDAMKKGATLSNLPNVINPNVIDKINNHFNSLISRPDYDGYLTVDEANDWYRNGNGQPLFTSLEKIDLSGIHSLGDDYQGTVKSYNLTLFSKSLNDGLVYGNITLRSYPNDKVRAFADHYDFEMHNPWNPLNWPRNIETKIGKSETGIGKSFDINIFGSKKLASPLIY